MSKRIEKEGKKQQVEVKSFNLVLIGLTLTAALLAFNFFLYFYNRFYPGVYVASVSLMGQDRSSASRLVYKTLEHRLKRPLIFTYQNQQFLIDLSSQPKLLDLDKPLNQAYRFGRSYFFLPPLKLELIVSLNDDIIKQIETIKAAVDDPAQNASLQVKGDSLVVIPAQKGTVIDEVRFKELIASYINNGELTSKQLPTRITLPDIPTEEVTSFKAALEKSQKAPAQLKFKDKGWRLDYQTLIILSDLQNARLDPQRLENYLKQIASEIDRPVTEPVFDYDGKKVTNFQPPLEGRKLDTAQAAKTITEKILKSTERGSPFELNLPVMVQNPKNQLVNQLGIKELVGEGVSHFAGSIANRAYNIGLAAYRLNGTLIAPGETFSFNDTVGDISAASGYKQAYVIKSGRTVLDDGGGVCQVSTTLFRTVLNSGLPVVTRTAHAYRVGYYEQGFPPGLDATIFAPSVDFKFKNDTNSHILIQARVVGESLYVDFYGTSDDRVASVTPSIITNQTPPPQELRQDDPTLPKGTIKQVDFPAWGARVTFSRTVTRNQETLIKETFYSNYRPWQAVYLVGSKEG